MRYRCLEREIAIRGARCATAATGKSWSPTSTRVRPDLVVMGALGTGAVKDSQLGSVADRVARRIRTRLCSSCAAPATPPWRATSSWPSTDHRSRSAGCRSRSRSARRSASASRRWRSTTRTSTTACSTASSTCSRRRRRRCSASRSRRRCTRRSSTPAWRRSTSRICAWPRRRPRRRASSCRSRCSTARRSSAWCDTPRTRSLVAGLRPDRRALSARRWTSAATPITWCATPRATCWSATGTSRPARSTSAPRRAWCGRRRPRRAWTVSRRPLAAWPAPRCCAGAPSAGTASSPPATSTRRSTSSCRIARTMRRIEEVSSALDAATAAMLDEAPPEQRARDLPHLRLRGAHRRARALPGVRRRRRRVRADRRRRGRACRERRGRDGERHVRRAQARLDARGADAAAAAAGRLPAPPRQGDRREDGADATASGDHRRRRCAVRAPRARGARRRRRPASRAARRRRSDHGPQMQRRRLPWSPEAEERIERIPGGFLRSLAVEQVERLAIALKASEVTVLHVEAGHRRGACAHARQPSEPPHRDARCISRAPDSDVPCTTRRRTEDVTAPTRPRAQRGHGAGGRLARPASGRERRARARR